MPPAAAHEYAVCLASDHAAKTNFAGIGPGALLSMMRANSNLLHPAITAVSKRCRNLDCAKQLWPAALLFGFLRNNVDIDSG